LEKNRMGQTRPLINPVSESIRLAVMKKIESMPGVEVVMMGRAAMHPSAGVHIMLASDHDIDEAVIAELSAVVHHAVDNNAVPVRVVALKSAEARSELDKTAKTDGID
jgi:hypothetical protein